MKKPSFFLSTTSQRGRMEPPSAPWSLGGVSKSKRNGADLAESNRKVFSSHWGLHDKKHGKVCPQLPPIFPASTVLNAVLNAGLLPVSRATLEAILYRVDWGNGTNNLSSDSPATVSSTITEILFLLRRKCPTANGYLFPILPQFDHLKTHFATTK